jgi:hypothetical protein
MGGQIVRTKLETVNAAIAIFAPGTTVRRGLTGWLVEWADSRGYVEAIAEDIQPGMRIERDGSWEKVLSVDPVRHGTQIETVSGIYTLNGLFKVAPTSRSTPPAAASIALNSNTATTCDRLLQQKRPR